MGSAVLLSSGGSDKNRTVVTFSFENQIVTGIQDGGAIKWLIPIGDIMDRIHVDVIRRAYETEVDLKCDTLFLDDADDLTIEAAPIGEELSEPYRLTTHVLRNEYGGYDETCFENTDLPKDSTERDAGYWNAATYARIRQFYGLNIHTPQPQGYADGTGWIGIFSGSCKLSIEDYQTIYKVLYKAAAEEEFDEEDFDVDDGGGDEFYEEEF